MSRRDQRSKEKRIKQAEIIKRIKKGWSMNKLAEWVQDHYKFSRTYSYTLVRGCYDLLAEHADDVIESAKMVQIERLEEMLTDALESSDKKTALQTLEMLNKIYGLYNQKTEVNINASSLRFEFE